MDVDKRLDAVFLAFFEQDVEQLLAVADAAVRADQIDVERIARIVVRVDALNRIGLADHPVVEQLG